VFVRCHFCLCQRYYVLAVRGGLITKNGIETVKQCLAMGLLLACMPLLDVGLPISRMACAESPNVLIILADDCTFSDLSIYGGVNAKTPNIERLASQGLTFNKAYVSSAMCQPCRAELYTGQFPTRNGCAWNHSACRPGTRSLPQYLKPLGYRTGIAGKVHVQPQESFPFENVSGFDPSCVREPTQSHDLANVREFMTRDSSQPFCLVVGLVEPHVPWMMGDASQYPFKKIQLPPHLADTPKTRQDFAAYLAEITYMDGQVGELLKSLDDSGQADNTLVLFSSEQGSQFPGGKWTCWDVGLHTALVARWPGVITAGKRTDAIVQYADITPTLVSIAGGQPSDASSSQVCLRCSQQLSRRPAVSSSIDY
jgi:N-sulfoglucosamine sulfohydrolase